MNARIANAMIARSLVDIGFLEEIDNRQILSSDGEAALQTLDLVRLRQFAGFITKVRHNYLWEELPYTRQLILLYGLETRVFTDYSPIFQTSVRDKELTRADKTHLFVEFLKRFLASDTRRTRFPALRDVLMHEWILLQMRNLATDGIPQRTQPETKRIDFQRVTAKTRIWIFGHIRCASFEYCPLEVISALSTGKKPAFVHHLEGDKAFVYWKRSSAETLEIFECDWLTFTILSLVVDRPHMTKNTLMKLLRDHGVIELLPQATLLNDCLNNLASASLLRVARQR